MRMQKVQFCDEWKHEHPTSMCRIMSIYAVELCSYYCIFALNMSTLHILRVRVREITYLKVEALIKIPIYISTIFHFQNALSRVHECLKCFDLCVTVAVDSIREICEGKQSEVFQRYSDGSFDPNCCFSLYYGEHMESLDLVTGTGEEARTWITGLRYLMAGISDEDSLAKRQRTRDQYPYFTSSTADVSLFQSFMLLFLLWILLQVSLTSDIMWLKQTFTEADKNGDGSLSISEVLQLLHKLNVNLPRQKVKQMFKVPNPPFSAAKLKRCAMLLILLFLLTPPILIPNLLSLSLHSVMLNNACDQKIPWVSGALGLVLNTSDNGNNNVLLKEKGHFWFNSAASPLKGGALK